MADETNTPRVLNKCVFVSDNEDGSQTYRGQVKAKDSNKVEKTADCEFRYYPSIEAAVTGLGEDKALNAINRQVKTDAMNDVRNEMLAVPTPQGNMRKIMRDLAAGTISKADAQRLLAEQLEAMEDVA